MMKKYYVFDMDGTIVDTGDGIVASLQATQRKLKLEDLPEKTLRLFLGPPLKESLMKYYGLTYEETDHYTDVYRECYLEHGLDKTIVFDKTMDYLNEIKNKGGKSAIATLKQHQLASAILKREGIDKIVDYIALNIDNSLGDKAVLINESLEKLGCNDKSQAVMVGDSPNDAEAANRAGVDFIALKYGEGFKAKGALDLYPYKYAVESDEELEKLISNLLQ